MRKLNCFLWVIILSVFSAAWSFSEVNKGLIPQNEISFYATYGGIYKDEVSNSSAGIEVQYAGFYRIFAVDLRQNISGRFNNTSLSVSIAPMNMMYYPEVIEDKDHWAFPLFVFAYIFTEMYVGVNLNYYYDYTSGKSWLLPEFFVSLGIVYPLCLKNEAYSGQFLKLGCDLDYFDTKTPMFTAKIGYALSL